MDCPTSYAVVLYYFWQRPRQPRLMAAGRADKETQRDGILTN